MLVQKDPAAMSQQDVNPRKQLLGRGGTGYRCSGVRTTTNSTSVHSKQLSVMTWPFGN